MALPFRRPFSIGMVGAGMMAEALARGFIRARLVEPRDVWMSDHHPARLDYLHRQFGVTVTDDNAAVVRNSAVFMPCVKPHQVQALLADVGPLVDARSQLVVSIAAGIRLVDLQAMLPARTRVVRVMPSTPATVSSSASAFSRGAHATADDAALVKRMFDAVGVAHEVDESKMEAVTGVSGSGPAYVFMVIQAMADGGVRAGLDRSIAVSLAAQTVVGAGKMVLHELEKDVGLQQHPIALRDAVCSAGGATIAAVHELEKGGLRATLMDAVHASATRAAELGRVAPAPAGAAGTGADVNAGGAGPAKQK